MGYLMREREAYRVAWRQSIACWAAVMTVLLVVVLVCRPPSAALMFFALLALSDLLRRRYLQPWLWCRLARRGRHG